MTAMEGQKTCARHGQIAEIKQKTSEPLNTYSSARDVSRKVMTKIKAVWGDHSFEIEQGYAPSGDKIAVLCWTNGPTVKEVNVELAELYTPMALGWGMSYGVPHIQFSRTFSPEVLVAALLHVMLEQEVFAAPPRATKSWTRSIFVPALDFLHNLTEPDFFISHKLLEQSEKLLVKFPPEEKLFDMMWISQICLLSIPVVKKNS